jgi:hypothetical protein
MKWEEVGQTEDMSECAFEKKEGRERVSSIENERREKRKREVCV